MKSRWFVSYSSHGAETTPTFFHALQAFDEANDKVEIIWPNADFLDLPTRKVEIDSAQLVIAEVSISSTNSGVDLGLAYAAKIPIIAFHQGTGALAPIIQHLATSINVYLTDEHIQKVLATLA